MKLLKIKNIHKDFFIETGQVYNINIENLAYYHQLVYSVLYNDASCFSYSENYEEKDLSKYALIILDPLNIDPNNKKILNGLYKKIQLQFFSEEDRRNLEDINSQVLNVLNQISLNMSLAMDYDTDLDIVKILNLYKFCFQNDTKNYLEKFVVFIKANLEVFSYSFIISFNLLSLLTKNEIEILKKELEYSNLSLINIQLIQKIDKNIVETITIDDDLCEF